MVVKKKVSLNDKLDLVLENQKKILENEQKILGEEEELKELELRDLEGDKEIERTEEEALKELAHLEKEFKKKSSSPIKSITTRDAAKGFVGSFLAVMGHFAFSKGYDIAQTLDVLQVTILYIVAFIMIVLMLYYTGFRQVKKHIVLKFMPLRAMILYSVSIVSILLINFLFGKLHFPIHFSEIYTLVGASIILAVMGAGTADLIGRNE